MELFLAAGRDQKSEKPLTREKRKVPNGTSIDTTIISCIWFAPRVGFASHDKQQAASSSRQTRSREGSYLTLCQAGRRWSIGIYAHASHQWFDDQQFSRSFSRFDVGDDLRRLLAAYFLLLAVVA